MAVNSSSSTHHSLVTYNLDIDIDCFMSTPGSFIITAYFVFDIFFLFPLSTLILYHCFQQYWKKHLNSSAAVMSHSDSFTYHLVVMELICNVGCIVGICGIHENNSNMMIVGFFLTSFTWYGETFFHILTCVERYLAVIYPIIYVSLRNERGVRIRNISIGCVWLLCFAATSLAVNKSLFVITDLCIVVLSFLIMSFCSFSVLYVLIRPGPGEQGANRQRTDQTKLRAFYTILAILGALVLRFVGGVVWVVFNIEGKGSECLVNATNAWFNVPSTLVLPLLFLYREGKSLCCKNSSQ